MPSHDPEDDHMLPTGYRLEEFEIVRVLGEGGFGIAYLAYDHTLHQQRVIKEFLPGQVARRDRSGLRITARTGQENRDIFSEGLRSFISEARLLASLDHPNVVRVYRCLEANGTAYLVMHYYEGQTLKRRIEALNGARPDADWVLRLLSAVLRGLQVVHGHGILHRDLKPDNIYLLADDRPVLIDFGAARRVVGGRTKALTGVITEGYSPIEQYIGDGGLQEGPWTDLYALGATGYWLVSGRKPWNAVMRMAGDALPPATTLGQNLYSPTFLASLDRALAVRPEDRYRTAAEWLTALEDPTVRVAEIRPCPAGRRPCAEPLQAPPPAPEPPTPPGPQTPTPGQGVWLWGFALLLMMAGLFWVLMGTDGIERDAPSAPPQVIGTPTSQPVPPAQPLSPPPPPVASEPRWISGELVYVRSGPGPAHPAITQLARGSEVTWLGASAEDSAWQRIRLSDGREGYVHGNLLSAERIEVARVSDPEMIRISGDCFQMGSPTSESGRIAERERQHQVCVEAFELGKYEVTASEFKRFVETTGYRTDAERNVGTAGCSVWSGSAWEYQAERNWRTPGFPQSDSRPVVCVSWNDAVAYVEWLSWETGQRYRLPTEAEWEYAARAGTTTAWHWGNDPSQVCRYANVRDRMAQQTFSGWTIQDCTDGFIHAAPVGTFAANPWGLHDMLGNVWEWTCSLYDKDYNGAETRCIDKVVSSPRALRGGSWSNHPAGVRSAYREEGAPTARSSVVGFRLARSL